MIRFFYKLFFSYAVLVVLTSIVIGLLLHNQLRRDLRSETETVLKEKVVLLSHFAKRLFESRKSEPLGGEMGLLGHQIRSRITFIWPDGNVLFDSERDASTMESHRDRPEVLASLNQPFGISERHSTTVQYNMLYVARAVRDELKLLGVVRVAIPLSLISERQSELRKNILIGASVAIVIALAFGLFIAKRVTTPLTQMTEVANEMQSGRFDKKVHVLPHDEIGVLGKTLNRLGDEIMTRISMISRDQAQLRTVLANMAEAVLTIDQTDRILFCNPAACRLLWVDENKCVGMKLWEVSQLSRVIDLVQKARVTVEPIKEEVVLSQGGMGLTLAVRAKSFSGGDVSGVIIVLQDISELRRLERIRKDFVANVSHELRTPLTSIRGYVETLLSGAIHDDDKNIRFLQKIEENVARLNNLTKDLLELAKIEAEGGALSLTHINLEPIVEEALRNQDITLKKKGLTMESSLSQCRILGNLEAISLVLDNLLDNAAKYTPAPGKISVRLSQKEGRAIIDVQDTGIGIPANDLDRIFERFYRVDRARSRELGGTGLGLSIVKHLVSAMNGQVRVVSEVGKGSTFSISFPLAEDDSGLILPKI